MKPGKLTKAKEEVLREQIITAEQPGPVLHDFEMLLEFLGTDGVEAGGKYNLIPIKLIGELDRRLSRPLELQLVRPQIRSHPYLQALNLLLRATGLGRVEGKGDNARLSIDPAMKMQWDQLNLVERYFNLLEAAFRFGRAEMVGERGNRRGGEILGSCLMTWMQIPEAGRRYHEKEPEHIYVWGVNRNWYMLALLEYFGLMEVDQPPAPVRTWYPAGVGHVPFGDAVLTVLDEKFLNDLGVMRGEESDETGQNPRFGAWQPLFQPFFPEWRQNLEFPSQEPREGMFIFRVSWDKMWRLIAMPSEATLDDLADCILQSIRFDQDHLYEFNFRDRLGADSSVNHPASSEGPWADEVAVGELPLDSGQTMVFVYDYGAHWKFDVKLERVEPRGNRKGPRILERHGKAPQQYPDWDG
jgi:hypothetical protein